uniref:Uncharacterized protein n=1 Tax=Podoviridae sp. ct9A73 TaxID=2825225 RepID=A0A8S5UJV3_9CAUD|nr:MAG TPA: hypothetical protein [Podoviridae sp. ct9A73]
MHSARGQKPGALCYYRGAQPAYQAILARLVFVMHVYNER